MTGDDRDAFGISHRFSGLVDALLDTGEQTVVMQPVHRRKRGGPGAQCGDTLGQISPLGTGITCPQCRAHDERLAKSSDARRAGKRRSA